MIEEIYNEEIICQRILQLKNINVSDISQFNFDFISWIHASIFSDIDDCAGKCRIKDEIVSNCLLSVIDSIKNYDLINMEDNQRVIFLAKYISDIWLFQPFFDGNTRTITVFLQSIFRYCGINFNYDFYNDNKTNLSGVLAMTFFEDEDRYKDLENIIRSNCNSTCLDTRYSLRNK